MSVQKIPDPPDLDRCQAEHSNGVNAFTLGGRHAMIRCTNKPTHVAHEGPRTDGLEPGSMSLCAKCLVICLKQMPGITITAIERAESSSS